MRTILFALITMVLIGSATVFAQRDQEVVVKVGKTAAANASGLKITLVSVLEDSRCPEDVTCIWAGRVVVKVNIATAKGEPQTFELSTDHEKESVVFNGYKVHFLSLEPKSSSERVLKPEDYIARFRIEMKEKAVKAKAIKRKTKRS